MKKELRKEEFRLGQIHGRLEAKNPRSEAHIQRVVFLSQRINLFIARGRTLRIRLFGYEVPLESEASRGRCADLMGYDERQNLYLIELKDENSAEKISTIEKQISDYKYMVQKRLPDIEKDFHSEFFLPIAFKGIYKMVLAPRQFYNPQRMKEIKSLRDENIIYADFGGRDIYDRKPGKPISVRLKKKCKLLFIVAPKKSAEAV